MLERIRLAVGPRMSLGDVAKLTVPKLTLVAPPRDGGSLCTRTFIPHRCHDAIGVLGAVSVATAALLPGSPAGEVAELTEGGPIVVEHPTGTFDVAIDARMVDGELVVTRSGIIRTARKLMDGVVFARSGRALMSRSIPPPHPDPHPPRAFTPPPGAIDAHCHIFGPADRFPFADDRAYTPPDAGIDDFERLQRPPRSRRRGLRAGELPRHRQRGDARRPRAAAQGRYAGVAMVDDTFTDAQLAELHDAGVRATRFNFVAHLGGAPAPDEFWPVVHRVAELGWHIVLALRRQGPRRLRRRVRPDAGALPHRPHGPRRRHGRSRPGAVPRAAGRWSATSAAG